MCRLSNSKRNPLVLFKCIDQLLNTKYINCNLMDPSKFVFATKEAFRKSIVNTLQY